jgi:hypothetical protein
MIRPITCLTFMLACGSGLYLYQAKHKVHVLDAQIEQVVRQTSQVREQTRVLHATWTLLDQPDRLQQLAAQFLTLQPTKPTQFASATDLDARLPPVPAPQPEPRITPPADEAPPLVAGVPEETESVVAVAVPAAPPASPRREPTTVAVLPPPVAAPIRIAERPVVHVPERALEPARSPATARLAAFEPPRPAPYHVVSTVPRPVPVYERPASHPVYQRPTYQRPTYAAPVYPRPAYQTAPAPQAAGSHYAAIQPAPAMPAVGGSMLGMARGAFPPPAPAPVWVNWNNR